MSKYLIVNSDDFAISEGVTRGILEAHQRGIVTSTSVMAHMPAAAASIRQAQQEAPRLGLGLHFTLSFGTPVSPPEKIPSLVTAAGTFCSDYPELMEILPHFTAEDLEIELAAQFNHFVELAGHPPDHLDSHHGSTYMHPAAFDIMMRLAEDYHLPFRSAGLDDNPELSDMPEDGDPKLVKQMLEIYYRHNRPHHPQHFLNPIFDWERSERKTRLMDMLQNVPDGTSEMMCHVGYGAGLEEAYTFQREDELAALTDPEVVETVKNAGIQLINFADLPG